jgi:hypothetical protein
VDKEWVRYEWDTFAIERLSGRKKGNLMTMAIGNVIAAQLPLALRQNQVFRWPAEQGRVLHYLGVPAAPLQPVPGAKPPPPPAPVTVREVRHVPSPSPLPAQADGATGRPRRRLGWLARYYWRPPIWSHDPRTGALSEMTVLLQRALDFLLRLVRLVILLYSTLLLVITPFMAAEFRHSDWEVVAFALFGSAGILWLGWLTSGLRNPKRNP